MIVRQTTCKKIFPGQPGTKKLVQKYGKNLFCVRYRYDTHKGKRFKTVEIIIEEDEWNTNSQQVPANKIVNVRIGYEEKYYRQLVKPAGASWNPIEKTWELPYRTVLELGLKDRIIFA